MKTLIFTDIHGSLSAFMQITEIVKKENAEKVIFLGDMYYHGPRNPLPDNYNPMGIAEMLKTFPCPFVIIKGNCDSEVDEMITGKKFKKSYSFSSGLSHFFCTHGHKLTEIKYPKNTDFVLFGHTHINNSYIDNGITFLNLSSFALPKNSAKKCYFSINNGVVYRKNEKGEILEECI